MDCNFADDKIQQDARRRTRSFFSEQECYLVTVLVCINLNLTLRKSCSVHMTVFLKLLFIAMFTNGHDALT